METSSVNVHLKNNEDISADLFKLEGEGVGDDAYVLRIMDASFHLNRQQAIRAINILKETIWKAEQFLHQQQKEVA